MNGSITITQKGSFKNSLKFLRAVTNKTFSQIVEPYVKEITAALSAATPVDTGKTAASWSYNITEKDDQIKITWSNSNLADGRIPVIVLLVHGHGTPSGHFVEGRDFITPTIDPLINSMIERFWKEVGDN